MIVVAGRALGLFAACALMFAMGSCGQPTCKCVCLACETVFTTDPVLTGAYDFDRDELDAYVPGTYEITLDDPTRPVDFTLVVTEGDAPRSFAYLTVSDRDCAYAEVFGCTSVGLPYEVELVGDYVYVDWNPVDERPLFVDGTEVSGPGSYPSVAITVSLQGGGSFLLEIRPDGHVYGTATTRDRSSEPPRADEIAAFVQVGTKL
jgi:hypothetical protein